MKRRKKTQKQKAPESDGNVSKKPRSASQIKEDNWEMDHLLSLLRNSPIDNSTDPPFLDISMKEVEDCFGRIAKMSKTKALGVLYAIIGPPNWFEVEGSDDVFKKLVIRADITNNLRELENLGLERFSPIPNTVKAISRESNTKVKNSNRRKSSTRAAKWAGSKKASTKRDSRA